MTIHITDLNFDDSQHTQALIKILSTYAQEEGGGHQSIPATTQETLASRLKEFPTRHVLLAMNDDKPVGVLVAFLGFSTFKARPVFSLHDLAVLPDHRGEGVGTALLNAAKQRAQQLNCCKLTLEVIDANDRAKQLYERCGFRNPVESSRTLFLEHPL